jgi:hypothetical protein
MAAQEKKRGRKEALKLTNGLNGKVMQKDGEILLLITIRFSSIATVIRVSLSQQKGKALVADTCGNIIPGRGS